MDNLESMTMNSEQLPIALMKNVKVGNIKGMFGKTFDIIRGNASDEDDCTLIYIKDESVILEAEEIRKQAKETTYIYPVCSPDEETMLKCNKSYDLIQTTFHDVNRFSRFAFSRLAHQIKRLY